MKIKKEFSFDEEKDALDIIKNGFPNKTLDYAKMYIVAKYFREKYNLGEKKLREILIKFCKKNDENFNPVRESKYITKWINSAMNYNLRVIDYITISEKDVEFLKNIETEKDRKIFFAILVLVKAFKKGGTKRDTTYNQSEKYYLRYSNFYDIIRIAELDSKNTKDIDIAKILYNYKEYFTFYYPEKELIRVEFVDKNPEKEIVIDNFERILDFYYLIFGEKIEKCTICGKEYTKRSNRQKYCNECAEKVKREQMKQIMRERRNQSD